MKKVFLSVITATALAAIVLSCTVSKDAQFHDKLPNKVVLQWNEAAYEAAGGVTYTHSLLAARVNAMVHIAMHDAINSIEPVYSQHTYKKREPGGDLVSAAASAAHTVLIGSFPAKKSMLDSLLNVSLNEIAEGTAKSRGLQVGQEAGQAILDSRATDGALNDPLGTVEPSEVAGVYQTVPPFNIVFAPHWKTMKLFGVERHDQFRSVAPPALNSEVYTVGFNEVKNMGKLGSSARTPDQTSFAKFWYEFSEIGWNRVARNTLKNRNMGLFASARLFALLNMALADAYTTGWDSKFHYNFWRPYTAIRAAAKDGNNNTQEDNSWEPAEPTPPVQDYPSTHSALGNAGAAVLAQLLGDKTAFSMTSFTSAIPGETRLYTSFSQAANENAESRVMAGIHFRFSCEAGQMLGTKVGNYIVQNQLIPLR